MKFFNLQKLSDDRKITRIGRGRFSAQSPTSRKLVAEFGKNPNRFSAPAKTDTLHFSDGSKRIYKQVSNMRKTERVSAPKSKTK